jgi:hypothetical protein
MTHPATQSTIEAFAEPVGTGERSGLSLIGKGTERWQEGDDETGNEISQRAPASAVDQFSECPASRGLTTTRWAVRAAQQVRNSDR